MLLREKDLGRRRRRALGRELAALLSPCAGRLIIASDWELAAELGAGVHLAADDAVPAGVRLDAVGRSCHDLAELRAAVAHGLAYATLSPIFRSSSKPGYGPALGVAGLEAGVSAVPGFPVYALGGVRRGNLGRCLAVGAAGVAVMGAVMGAEDPLAAARELLAAVGARNQPKSAATGR